MKVRSGRSRVRAALAVGALVTGLAVPSGAPPAGAESPEPSEAVAGELLVTLAPGRSPQGVRALGVLGVDRLSDRVVRVRVPAGLESAVAGRLSALGGVLAAEPNRRLDYTATPDDQSYPDQWAHQLTGIEQAWSTTAGSSRVTVAVLDSGIDGRHPELGNIVDRRDASTGVIRQGHVDNDLCGIGHGTMVAGIVGAVGDNGGGIAGVNWRVSLVDVALSSPDAGCEGPTDAAVVAALDWVTSRRVDAVNMSFGTPADACPTAYQAAFDAARAAGVVLVAAAGNEEEPAASSGRPRIPAACRGVISVGATGSDGHLARYSTANRWVDLVAPGGDRTNGGGAAALVLTTVRDSSFRLVEGSSFSTPYVTGLVALLRAARDSMTSDQIEAVLEATARDLGRRGRDPAYGWGLVQSGAAMARTASGSLPALSPDPDFPVGVG
ncbi:MAG: S8 family peptidase [Egibacteraceae bacterium]